MIVSPGQKRTNQKLKTKTKQQQLIKTIKFILLCEMISNDHVVVIKSFKYTTRSETNMAITIIWDQVWPKSEHPLPLEHPPHKNINL